MRPPHLKPSDPVYAALRAGSTQVVERRLDLRVEGLQHVPSAGPVIIAARHFHHLFDGCAILSALPRPVHILVALDWVRSRPGRFAMERACRAAGWPVVLRPGGPGQVDELQAARAFRAAAKQSLALLAAGRALLIFPEGYPNVDPGYTPKQSDSEFLPFHPGVVRIASLAAAHGMHVPLVPAGFSYRRGTRWQATLRFGEPLVLEHRRQESTVLQALESRVRALCLATVDQEDQETAQVPFPQSDPVERTR